MDITISVNIPNTLDALGHKLLDVKSALVSWSTAYSKKEERSVLHQGITYLHKTVVLSGQFTVTIYNESGRPERYTINYDTIDNLRFTIQCWGKYRLLVETIGKSLKPCGDVTVCEQGYNYDLDHWLDLSLDLIRS